MINNDGLLIDLSEEYLIPVSQKAEVRTSIEQSIFELNGGLFDTWSTHADKKTLDRVIPRLRKNKTIQSIRVSIKSIQLEGPKHHRAIYERLYEAYHSGEYLEGNGWGRYMCNIIQRRAKTLAHRIAGIRFELFIENLLLELSQAHEVTTVAGLHKCSWAHGKTDKMFDEYAREFYEALMSDFRESFQKD